MQRNLLQLFYLLSAILFVMGLRGLSHPKTARRGMFLAEFGMLLAIVAGMLALIGSLMFFPASATGFYSLVRLAFCFGGMLILPIGAADRPVVISLLNAYAKLTDAAMGFMLDNKLQIIPGSVDGS